MSKPTKSRFFIVTEPTPAWAVVGYRNPEGATEMVRGTNPVYAELMLQPGDELSSIFIGTYISSESESDNGKCLSRGITLVRPVLDENIPESEKFDYPNVIPEELVGNALQEVGFSDLKIQSSNPTFLNPISASSIEAIDPSDSRNCASVISDFDLLVEIAPDISRRAVIAEQAPTFGM